MVVTRQRSKALVVGSETAGPYAAILNPEYSFGSEESPSPERPKRRRALVHYSLSAIIEEPSDVRASKPKEKDLDSIAWKHGIPRDALLLPTEEQRANNPLEGYIAWS